jgi:oxygen-dependent protoporphyrinogen oxidase
MSADRVVLACPAHVNCGLVEKVSVDLATELGNIPYSSAVLVMLLYRRDTVDHPLNGFGFLVPRSERRMVAAATWVNTKWPSRIRPDFVALRAFIVGEDADAMISADQQQAVEVARQEFERLMGIAAAPVFSTVHFLPSAMPQYIVGHQDRVAKIRASADALSGLHLVGNAYDGVGIPDCIRLARRAADEAV